MSYRKKIIQAIKNNYNEDLITQIVIDFVNKSLGRSDKDIIEWNVSLITSLSRETRDNLEKLLAGYRATGLLPDGVKSLEQAVRRVGKVSDNRAKLIARDQTAKLNAFASKERQENAGVKEFVWLTAEDSRVRSSHAKHDNKVFKWSEGADGIFPGDEIQCRCVAVPVVEEGSYADYAIQ